jgi:hypothetical protein
MSHSIIFETIFVKLSDGRLLHLDRSGCNNDDAGRSRDDFTGKIYTCEALQKRIQSYMSDDEPTSLYQLKINSKWRSYYQYGEHLARMSKRAVPYDEFITQRTCTASRYDGAEVYKPVEKTFTAKEFNDVFYEYLYSGQPFEYRRLLTMLKTEADIVKALDNNEPVSFYVSKNHRRRAS